ncbi:MAG: DNA/RNA non-specific endonuclease [Xylophilus ampelinus]
MRFSICSQALSAILVLSALLPALGWSATACSQHFALGAAPVITNPKLQPRTREVCFEAYAVLHSGLSRTPLYAAEHLTRANLEAARTLSRKDSFHPESALPAPERAELSDYSRSGYDRGHMAPNGDMPTRSAQAESFSLANMVPQVHANNAGVWAGIEGAVRQLAIDEGELYVVSGPAFLGGDLKQIGNVLVPTHIWKVVYSPRQQKAGAYLVTNDETRDYAAMSVSDLGKLVGVQALPGVAQAIRDAGMSLPRPINTQGGGRKKNRDDAHRPQRSDRDAVLLPAGEDDGGYTLKDLSRSVMEAIPRAGR